MRILKSWQKSKDLCSPWNHRREKVTIVSNAELGKNLLNGINDYSMSVVCLYPTDDVSAEDLYNSIRATGYKYEEDYDSTVSVRVYSQCSYSKITSGSSNL